jgi:hypothetical protein
MNTKAEQNGCRQRLEWHLSCHRRFPLAVAALEAVTRVTVLDASKRLGMPDDPLLRGIW